MAGRIALMLLLLSCWACAGPRSVERLRGITTTLSPGEESAMPETIFREQRRDTLTVTDADGKEIHILRAVKDIDGEMVATDILSAARVTARFRNIAERNGRIELRFDVRVPAELHDSRRQLRLFPVMDLLGEQIPLEPILLTGTAHRKAQLRGYEQYRRFVNSIITDSTLLTDRRQLELFIRRNIPEIYRFRNDTSRVSDEMFASAYGVTQEQAGRHYALRHKIRGNNRKAALKERMFERYVKSPIRTEGLRLDTVLTGTGRDFIYAYVQTVRTRPGLRKIGITVSGALYEQDRCLLRLPESDTLTFYVSSLSGLAEPVERYRFHIVERQAEAHTACYIEFAPGSAAIDPGRGENAAEIVRIRSNIRELAVNDVFEMDSVVVTASCSPEGSWSANERLSRLRAEALSQHFREHLQTLLDSIRRSEGILLNRVGAETPHPRPVRFIAHHRPEDWETLDKLVTRDTLLSAAERAGYFSLRRIPDADWRETALQAEPFYRHLREKLYPKLRAVRFDFYLHRRGMTQDTVHTTLPDTVYRDGLRALRERDYVRAVTLLRPYRDRNAAVAFLCAGYDASAREILDGLERTAAVEYMTAVLHARAGEERPAVEAYLQACRMDPSFVHRGQLDPEIAELIREFGLDRTDGPASSF